MIPMDRNISREFYIAIEVKRKKITLNTEDKT